MSKASNICKMNITVTETESLEETKGMSKVALYLQSFSIFTRLLRCMHKHLLYLHDANIDAHCKY